MSGGKGEALASELAALSVNEASAPPEGDGEKPSAEPAEGADSGGKITGVVSWFNVAKGFGFVTRDDGEGDVFVHQSDVYSQGFRSLRNQEPVEFGLEPIGDGRFKAVNVTGPNGAFVQGAVARNANKTRSPFMANRGAGIPGMYGPGAYFGGVPFAGPMPPGMPPGMVPGIPYGVGPHTGMMGPGGFPGAMGMVPMPNPPMMGEYGPGGGRRVVVLNLPWHTSWQALKQFFASAGEVERADVALDESGKSRGYGTVRYATETQAMNAIRTLNGLDFEGRILTVRMDKYQE